MYHQWKRLTDTLTIRVWQISKYFRWKEINFKDEDVSCDQLNFVGGYNKFFQRKILDTEITYVLGKLFTLLLSQTRDN